MKRFWLILLSLGLVMAFSVSAFAVDVKVSGEYFAAGMYLNKTNLNDTDIYTTDNPPVLKAKSNLSTAFYFQRLRVGTDFIVAPGLKLVTRFDAMERIWGGQRSAPGTTLDSQSAGTRAENENIAFDLMYINYESPIGLFRVGYMTDLAWGTVFMDSSIYRGKVAWSNTTGSWSYGLQIIKSADYSVSAVPNAYNTSATDADNDKYCASVKYTWKGGEAGVLGAMYRDAANRPTKDSYDLFYGLLPYAIFQIGPVKVQAELDYFWGNSLKYDSNVGNISVSALAAFLDATANFGIFYAGGTFAYVSGDDPGTKDKAEGFAPVVDGGKDWNPCLILFNNDVTYWVGGISGHDGSGVGGYMYNAWFGQLRGGVRPMPQLDAMLSVSYAQADKKPTGFANGTYGTEIDLTGTYKITNNLSYMLGVGYLFTGDYFKGDETKGPNKINDDFMLINKLTLTF